MERKRAWWRKPLKNLKKFHCKIKVKKKKKSFLTSDLVTTVTLRESAPGTYETHGPAGPRKVHAGHLVCVIHARTPENEFLSLLFSPLSRSAGWQPTGLPSSLPPPPYATGAPKKRELSFRPAVSCVTPWRVHGTTTRVSWPRETVIRRRLPTVFPRVRRTRCTSQGTVTSRTRESSNREPRFRAPPFWWWPDDDGWTRRPSGLVTLVSRRRTQEREYSKRGTKVSTSTPILPKHTFYRGSHNRGTGKDEGYRSTDARPLDPPVSFFTEKILY